MNKNISLLLIFSFILIVTMFSVTANGQTLSGKGGVGGIQILPSINTFASTSLDKYAKEYPAIEITNLLGLGGVIADIQLDKHTGECGASCSSELTINTYSDSALVDGVKTYYVDDEGNRGDESNTPISFYYNDGSTETINVNDYTNVCHNVTGNVTTNYSITQQCNQVISGTHEEEQEVWTPYNIGDVLPAGEYKLKIDGKKKMMENIDWVINTQGKTLNDMAVWSKNNNLVSYYKLDETTGTNVKDEMNLNNGTWNVSSLWKPAVINNGAKFNTTSNFYTNPIVFVDNFTYGGWFNFSDYNYNYSGMYTQTRLKYDGYGIYKLGNKFVCRYGTYNSTNYAFINATSITNYNLNQWYNVYCIRSLISGTNYNLSIYVDGSYESSNIDTYNMGLTINISNKLAFGSDNEGVFPINGMLDEIGFWNTSLSLSDIQELYNSGSGLQYPFTAVNSSSVTLNKPDDLFTTNNNTILFNCSATSTGMNISNIDLLTNETTGMMHVVYTNNTSSFNTNETTLILSRTMNDGSYSWTCESCLLTNCTNATARTFSIDATLPNINLINGSGNQGAYNGQNLTIYYNISDTHLSSCWLNYNSTNRTIPCTNNMINTTNFSVDTSNTNAIIYANDTYGNINSYNFNWSYSFLINGVSYNSITLQSKSENFELNITTDGSKIPIGYLIYNGNSYLVTSSNVGNNYIFDKSLILNNAGNYSFYFIINYGSSIINSSSYNQTVTALTNVFNVSQTNCGSFGTAINISFYDEQNLTYLNDITGTYNFNLGISNSSAFTLNGTYNNLGNILVCINSSAYNDYTIGYGEINYYDIDRTPRKYYLYSGTRVSNSTTNINAYDLLTSAPATTFQINVKDPNLNTFKNGYINLIRWYPVDNTYKTVEISKTDGFGNGIFKIKTEDVDYRIGVYYTNGTLVYLADPIRFVCASTPCSYYLTIPSTETQTYQNYLDVQTQLYYQNGTFTFIYNDPSQTTSMMELDVYYVDGTNGQSLVCLSNSTSYVGVLTCDIGTQKGLFHAVGVRSASPANPIISLDIDTLTNIFQGTFGLFLTFMIALVLILLGLVSPPMAIILGIIAMIPALVLHTVTYPIVIGIAILGGIVIHFMRKAQ